MAILTKTRLTALTEGKLGYTNFKNELIVAKQQNKYLATTTVFLSHSHSERDYVEKAVIFLRHIGIQVYVDWLDSSMPPLTNADTAKKLKEKIKECKKFILLASNNAINSKWCNWELGFGDAQKYIDHIALFPLAENSGTWEGSEYLKIYPRIEEGNYIAEYYKIVYPDGTEKTLYDWLKL